MNRILLLVLAGLGIGCRSDVVQQDAIALARSKGADIRISVKGDAQRVNLRGCQLDPELKSALKLMPAVESLLVGNSFSDADADVLDTMASLKNLDLSHSDASVQILGRLLEIRTLEFLALNGMELTDSEMEVVTKLRQLKSISFVDAKVSEAALADFREQNPDCIIAQ